MEIARLHTYITETARDLRKVATPMPEQTPASSPKITLRDPGFTFADDLPISWHSGDPAISHFYNGLSLTFPEGERFFVESVRAFADQIDDPKLKTDVRGFAGQEAIHSREHVAYNKYLAVAGLEPERIERLVTFGLKIARKLPLKSQLAITCALEHYTALFAEVILANPRVMEGAHPQFANLWRWHAMEESEHKAVAFDVMKTVDPGVRGYLRRVLVMTITTLEFNLVILSNQIYLMAKAGELTNWRSWARSLNYLWGRPGVWRRILVGVLPYYRPSFHPNDSDTQALLEKWRAWYQNDIQTG